MNKKNIIVEINNLLYLKTIISGRIKNNTHKELLSFYNKQLIDINKQIKLIGEMNE